MGTAVGLLRGRCESVGEVDFHIMFLSAFLLFQPDQSVGGDESRSQRG